MKRHNRKNGHIGCLFLQRFRILFISLPSFFIEVMEEAMKFEESVMWVDVAFLNRVIEDLKRNFSRMLKRELRVIDFSDLVAYIALDAGLSSDPQNKVQVLLIHDDLSERIVHTQPALVEKELNNVAFKSGLGEFSFYAFRSEGFVSKEDFLIESAKVVLAEKEVKQFWIVAEPDRKAYEALQAILDSEEARSKKMLSFCMSEPSLKTVKWELLGYPVMQALGIRSDELD